MAHNHSLTGARTATVTILVLLSQDCPQTTDLQSAAYTLRTQLVHDYPVPGGGVGLPGKLTVDKEA